MSGAARRSGVILAAALTTWLGAAAVFAAPAPVLQLGVDPGSPNGDVIVKRGETIGAIARRYGLRAADIAAFNQLSPPYALKPGARLLLPPPRSCRVGKNDTLYSLARLYGVPERRLAEANRLAPPYRIHPGERLRIPRPGEELARKDDVAVKDAAEDRPRHAAESPRRAGGEHVRLLKKPGPSPGHRAFSAMLTRLAGPDADKDADKGRGADKNKPARHYAAAHPAPGALRAPAPETERPAEIVAASRRPGFVWPVRGRVISGFGLKDGGLYNDGINIAAPRGTPVRSAADGTVAYVGDKLQAYGKLVLIRHAGGMMTAYAHLNTVAVRPGERVGRGEAIGSVGSTGAVAHAQLHFELRRGTEKIDPRRYLG